MAEERNGQNKRSLRVNIWQEAIGNRYVNTCYAYGRWDLDKSIVN